MLSNLVQSSRLDEGLDEVSECFYLQNITSKILDCVFFLRLRDLINGIKWKISLLKIDVLNYGK